MRSSSRRTFLKTAAGVAAGTVLSRGTAWAQEAVTAHTINPQFMITAKQAWDWHVFKSECGPTYAGSAGWKRFTDFVVAKLPEFGAVDLDFVDIPYDHYIVEDWPDRRTHMHDSSNAVEKLITDGTPVPVVASYGMTSGSTPRDGVTARMVFYDPAHPPSASDIAGKILVFETAKYPQPPYSNSFLDNYTPTDYEWRSPGAWHELFTPPPTSVTTSYHTRWVWSQLGGFATIATKNGAVGMVVVYDLSPAAAFGLTQRSVYTSNCPTLTLDRVNGAKAIADAKAGKTATLTLIARFQKDTGRAMIAHLPGKHYGTRQDEQVLIATHTDAMSLIEENGAFGLLGILSYWNKVPRSARARTLTFYLDCRHFMPGGEGAWPQYDYYTIHPDRLKSIVATLGVEHMGGRQTIEVGDHYEYSRELPENGGVITSLMDVYNNNIWFVEAIARAATANHWPRVDVKAGSVAPGVNGGFQGSVKSPMNKGRAYKVPGIGLAGDWPGAWTQTFSQIDTEAGPHGFDSNYFVRQVAGLTQLAGELMLIHPRVIDLGWGTLKSAIVKLEDPNRQKLLDQYVAAFRYVERGDVGLARATLDRLASSSGLKTAVDDVLRAILRSARG